MDRPLTDKRPLGPFAQMGGGCADYLGIIVHYGKPIPEEQEDEAVGNLTGHLSANGVSVKEGRVGPEGSRDSIWVTLKGKSFHLEDVRGGVSASVAEMEDSGINVDRNPDVEVILESQ